MGASSQFVLEHLPSTLNGPTKTFKVQKKKTGSEMSILMTDPVKVSEIKFRTLDMWVSFLRVPNLLWC